MTYDRTLLPNGCSCSVISVTPANWKQLKKITRPWRIHYRFYDPTQPRPKQVNIKLMNNIRGVEDRKENTKLLIADELKRLKGGWNPFYKKVITSSVDKYNIADTTLFIPALYKALERKKLDENYRKHIKNYILPNVEKAAINLGYSLMYITEVKRKHIIFILDHLGETNERFSNYSYNRFRTDLKILFRELVLIDVIETNIMNDIPVKQLEQKEKVVLSKSERIFINNLLQTKYPSFHRLLNIYFHGFTRETELMRLKGRDVDLEGQRFRVLIKKGRNQRTVWKVIQTEALQYWKEQMKGCGDDDYVFSVNLLPGKKQIRTDQITKRWYRLIKSKEFIINGVKTRIKANFQCLHHLAVTELVNYHGQKTAGHAKGHTSDKMVALVYDIKSKERMDDDIKSAPIKFG
jgi:site-specific recombinase XerC